MVLSENNFSFVLIIVKKTWYKQLNWSAIEHHAADQCYTESKDAFSIGGYCYFAVSYSLYNIESIDR